ncbi:DUF6622 family protein [Xenophilus azovorans]|uniref:DUF6622 family protein n=1 Tax=Xenophilus azovorans TaxID=151755 RepID=UPI000570AE92|nr:DUF6622 family protein [Xenophilus azovorans]
MLIQILAHTPTWVFAVFALLAWMGGRQLRPGSTPLARAVALPLAMVAFAAYGVATAFGHAGAGPLAMAGWAAAAAVALATVSRVPLNPSVRYDAGARRFHQPGSAVPLALMMGIFLTKYAVGVTLAFHPAYAHQAGFAVGVSTLYGLFSGVFAGRALRLVRLAARRHAVPAAA